MTFFSANLFAGGGYACAKRGAALVHRIDATAKEAAEATRRELDRCDAVLVGAGAGLSTAAGFSYSGKRFDENFADFRDRFGITDMYSGGFHPFPDLETYWAWWSRAILLNRYEAGVGKPYLDLLHILEGRDYFVLTTNVDHQFQLARFDKARLFYTQGGLRPVPVQPQLLLRDVRQRGAGPRDGTSPARPAGAKRARSPLFALRGAHGSQPARRRLVLRGPRMARGSLPLPRVL